MEDFLSLELKLISCKHLKAFNFFQKFSVYAVVSVFNDEEKKEDQQCLQPQKTLEDGEGGGNPEWNHVMQFDLKAKSLPLQDGHLFLKFKLRCGGVVFGNRTIGEVRVPLKDLIDEFKGSVRFLSYEVRNSDGKPNGVLNFSYSLKGKPEKRNELSPDRKAELPCRIPFSQEKIDVKSGSSKCLYPCLDDVRSPLTGASFRFPHFYYQTQLQETYAMPPSPVSSQLPAFTVGQQRVYYHPCPSPLWDARKTVSYGYQSGCPN